MGLLQIILSKSPIKFRKMLVYKLPQDFRSDSIVVKDDLYFKTASADLIANDNSLKGNKTVARHFRQGYKGHFCFDKKTDELVGYFWYVINEPPPTSIPKIPQDSAWIFNMFINEKFRGNGYQNNLTKEFLKVIPAEAIHKFADVLVDNIPSRKNFLKIGFQPIGVYYILIFGIRRYKSLNFKFGYWNKSEQHPPIKA